ncbi:type I polyketide synthase [Mycolicibacterium sp. F2034L]|uniref:sulfolipid-1 biosynthesis phthioceranic/hydroxyphthioceranic acid synthase n=1 Tax=Mycolicibacterium sp. F2034L TaxID=2926422 RepID=UPI001FF2DEC3|nr:type I polyketide synthase [Mycolicibacterium sp. F2034L]MCK0174001.1 acyltransferase domain-containing protein [Mycolicibacterium sp. F2034L]
MTARTAEPVAVIGMACRLPGGIDSPERLWAALLRGANLVTEAPADRWEHDAPRWGAFLDDVAGFDAKFFGIDDDEAAALDPHHRLLLETAWEAVEHAGLDPSALTDSLAGVFVGLTGTVSGSASDRIAGSLGLRGPALTVDTACSSGLTAVHLGCRSLSDGESDLVLVGGASLVLDPRTFVAEQGDLSPTGRCSAFDAAADGCTPGEAVAVVVLKRLTDAQRDGDRILGVIRGTAVGHDSRDGQAHATLYRAALDAAGVDAGTVAMIEAHGPGTPAADAAEYAGLCEVYGVDSSCAVGSVKTNLGHTRSASGLLGLIKTVLALQHGVIPEHLHFSRLPDAAARIGTDLFVPQELVGWPAQGRHPRRAAVSSHGASGTNVHAVLEQAPEPAAEPAATTAGPLLFPLSSTSPEALRRSAVRLAEWIQDRDEVALPDVAYTLARRRAHRPVRTAVLAESGPGLAEALRELAAGDTAHPAAVGDDDRGPVWVFSGQATPWAGMGADLLAAEPAFAAAVEEIEPLVRHESGFSVTEAMSGPEAPTGVDRIEPTLFAMQVAAATALAARGARPGAVIGRSTGEIAAAVVAGALSLADGVRVVCRSSRLMATVADGGAMAEVDLPAKQVLSELTQNAVKDAAIAVVAAPQTTVIAGAATRVHDFAATWRQRDVGVREIAVDVAANSPQLDPILTELAAALADVEPLRPTVPYYSATGFDPREEPVCDGRYWVQGLRRTVRFSAAVRAALEDGYRIFAELGPHPVLAEPVERTARSLDLPLVTLAALQPGADMPCGLAGFVAELHTAGAAVDFSVPYPTGRLIDTPLPSWTHRRFSLADQAPEATTPGGRTVSVHPLLGPHVQLQQQPERYVWRAEVGTAAHPWLAELGTTALPAAVYCEMAMAAAGVVLGERTEVRDLHFGPGLPFDEGTSLGAAASLSPPAAAEFVVESTDDGMCRRQVTATLGVAAADDEPSPYDLPALAAAYAEYADGAVLPILGTVRISDDAAGSVFAELAMPDELRSQQGAFGVHPMLLDACLRAVAASPRLDALDGRALGSPVRMRRLRVHRSVRGARYCHVRVTRADATGVDADLDLLDEHGTVLLSAQGCAFGTETVDDTDRVLDDRLLSVDWHPRRSPEPSRDEAGSWLVLTAATSAGTSAGEVTTALRDHGAHCTAMSWFPHGDHVAAAAALGAHLSERQHAGVAIVTGPGPGTTPSGPLSGLACTRHLLRIAREVTGVPGRLPHLVVVTRTAQTVLRSDVADLDQGGVRGLLRVLGAELPHLRVTHIDVDERTGPAVLAGQLLSDSDEDETAWRDGVWHTARLRPAPLRPEDRQTIVADHEHDGFRLQIRNPGDLETLEPVSCARAEPGPGQIEIAVHASSLNFADVLVAMGRYPSDGETPGLGTDFAGVVTRVGPDVTDHRVGDRVGGFSPAGCWGTFLTCDTRLAVPLPRTLTDQEAVAAATATVTAWYGLYEQARISSSDRVLIHSATGGVGQAAIAIARAAGAQIYATAGTAERRELLRNMGIEHVYDSRSTAFADEIRHDTAGYGVDIVLNSLTGAAQRAGLELLAAGGRFAEIGKRDVYGNTQLGLYPFRRNLTFHYVDLALLASSHPRRVAELLRTVFGLVADGALPAPRHTTYRLADAADAIRTMAAAQHTGKLVLEVPRPAHSTVVTPPEQVRVFRPDGAYVVTDGLSDLGLFLAEKMADGGCGRIVLTSPAQPTLKALETIELIRVMGADVVVHCGDIADPDTAQRLLATATTTGLPVRGVVHAAAGGSDAALADVTDDLLEKHWAAKVHGAWNLHTATVDQPLDWFCSFSSAAALVGAPGCGASATANSWLDSFSRWRRAQGLPATAIAWGAWSRIGNAPAAGADAGAETAAIAPDEGARAFEALLRHDRAHTGYAPIAGSTGLTTFAHRSPFAEAFRRSEENHADTGRLRLVLEALPAEERPGRLRRLISDQISLVLRRSIDADRPLSEYGVDSLGALELRTRIESETGIRLATSDLADRSVRDLADLLCLKLSSDSTAGSGGS